MDLNEEMRMFIQSAVREAIMQLVNDDIIEKEKEHKSQTLLLEYYDKWITNFEKQVKVGQKADSTLRKHKTVYSHLKNFIRQNYSKDDIYMQNIDHDFPANFNLFLHKKGLTLNSRCVYIGSVQMLFRLATKDELIDKNPFCDFHISMEDKARGFLTKDELNKLKGYVSKDNKNEQVVLDLFLFCCYTGLSFADLVKLTNNDLVDNPLDDKLWIHSHRKKTGVEATLRLLPTAVNILSKHRQPNIYNNVFSVPSYKTCNRIMKKIATECGINKKVTWHIARHTMATTICLSNGMSIEAVAKILGHKKLKSTQIYAKVTQEALGKEMDNIEYMLSNK